VIWSQDRETYVGPRDHASGLFVSRRGAFSVGEEVGGPVAPLGQLHSSTLGRAQTAALTRKIRTGGVALTMALTNTDTQKESNGAFWGESAAREQRGCLFRTTARATALWSLEDRKTRRSAQVLCPSLGKDFRRCSEVGVQGAAKQSFSPPHERGKGWGQSFAQRPRPLRATARLPGRLGAWPSALRAVLLKTF
jgi:hypothetical protein